MSPDQLAVALAFWAQVTGLETPAIEPVIGLPHCAQAIGRPISGALKRHLIVQVDFDKCKGLPANEVALHESIHFRLFHHEGQFELDEHGAPVVHGKDFKRLVKQYRYRARRMRR